MGFIHDTGDAIFTLETRRDSVILGEETGDRDECHHVFLPHEASAEAGKIIERYLRAKAGVLFSNRQDVEAQKYRDIADEIAEIKIGLPRPSSFEVSKEWLRQVVDYANENPIILE